MVFVINHVVQSQVRSGQVLIVTHSWIKHCLECINVVTQSSLRASATITSPHQSQHATFLLTTEAATPSWETLQRTHSHCRCVSNSSSKETVQSVGNLYLYLYKYDLCDSGYSIRCAWRVIELPCASRPSTSTRLCAQAASSVAKYINTNTRCHLGYHECQSMSFYQIIQQTEYSLTGHRSRVKQHG